MTTLMTIDAQDVRVGDQLTSPQDGRPTTVVSIRRKDGKFRGKNGGPYTIYIILDDQGNELRLAPYSSVWVRR